MTAFLPFTLHTYPTVPLDLIEEVNALDTLCFRHNYLQTSADHMDQDEKFCSEADIVSYILVKDAQHVIGETRVYKRSIQYEGRQILLGGIGSVGTHPDKRRQGVAIAMLTKAMDLLDQHTCDVVYLCADTYNEALMRLYEQFGFTRLDKTHTYLGKSGKRHTDRDGMVAPMRATDVYKKILAGTKAFDIGVGNW
jgi:ribosomal protein S18 acetylase RimI-like enzyme